LVFSVCWTYSAVISFDLLWICVYSTCDSCKILSDFFAWSSCSWSMTCSSVMSTWFSLSYKSSSSDVSS
jgi:hypothetical protein